MSYALFTDIGSTFTKVTAADLEACRIVGRAMSPTTIFDDVNIGFQKALALLTEQVGHPMEFDFRLACSSAAGGLKMVACGLVPDLTSEAARLASLSAGAKVLKAYAYKMTDTEAKELTELQPDIVMLSGGTDGGNSEVMLHNAKVLADCPLRFPVIIAGNKSAAGEAARLIEEAGKEAVVCPNVMPEFGKLNIEPAREAVRKVFLERIVDAKGLRELAEKMDGDIIPPPASVLDAITLLSRGTRDEEGIGSLMAFDIGGATTDVYSVTNGCPVYSGAMLKGLPHPAAKRSVEGDLGMRWNARTIVALQGEELFAEDAGVTVEELRQTLNVFDKTPDILPQNEAMEKIDVALAKSAAKNACERHAGHLEVVFTPLGERYMQTGKDLSDVKWLIGTGGPVITSKDPAAILSEASFSEQEPLSLPEVAARKDTLLPVWMFGGSEEAFLVPDRPADGNRTAYTLEAWRRLNHIEPAHVQDWTVGWHTYEMRWDDLIYRKDGMPLVGFTRVQDMPHATTIEMSRRIWDEFFSRFSRVDSSIVYHDKEDS